MKKDISCEKCGYSVSRNRSAMIDGFIICLSCSKLPDMQAVVDNIVAYKRSIKGLGRYSIRGDVGVNGRVIRGYRGRGYNNKIRISR